MISVPRAIALLRGVPRRLFSRSRGGFLPARRVDEHVGPAVFRILHGEFPGRETGGDQQPSTSRMASGLDRRADDFRICAGKLGVSAALHRDRRGLRHLFREQFAG